MEWVNLGRAGLKVSRPCLGTMTFGREADEATSFRILDRYTELGGCFVDTADMYSAGGSEEVVGRWLKQRGNREAIVLATKVWAVMGPGPNDGGLSRRHIQSAVEASLRRLQTDVIDLYQIHRWDASVPPEETLETLNDLVRQGKVRYIGASNLRAWQLAEYQHLAERHHWSHFVSIQPLFNALNRNIENELLPYAARAGIGVITYNPLAGGMLTGKYRPGEPLPPGTRLEAFQNYYERYYAEAALELADKFVQAARERGVTPAQLALAWVMADPRVTCPILGARSLEQLDDTIAGAELKLSAEERAAIPAVLPGRWVGRDPYVDYGL
ncbi:MAG: aldo/keto reductase [Chloroflexi bacterium]|nr:aldo/keto reductase [Chloroflexota bacterium]